MRLLNTIAGLVAGTWLARVIFGVRWLHFEYGTIQQLAIPLWLYETTKALYCLFWLYLLFYLSHKKKKRKYILPKT